MGEVLVLNNNYQPLNIITWKKAILLWFGGKVEVLTEYEDIYIRSPRLKLRMPCIIQLKFYVKYHYHPHKSFVAFSRKNVHLRDSGSCQYCGNPVSLSEMTLDHIIPRSQGGRTEWDNVVTACQSCNNIKGDRLLKETPLKLAKSPEVPRFKNNFFQQLLKQQVLARIRHPSWQTYLE